MQTYHDKCMVDTDFEGRGRIRNDEAIVVEYLSIHAPTLGLRRHIARGLIAERPQGALEKVRIMQRPNTGHEMGVILSIHATKPVVIAWERGAVRVIQNRGDECDLSCFGFVKCSIGSGMKKSVV